MGVQSELVIADRSEASAVAASDHPAGEWEGFSFKGLDNIKLCTLLSLLGSNDSSAGLSHHLSVIEAVVPRRDGGPEVFVVPADQAARLAEVAAMEEDEFDRMVADWGETEEFEGWSQSEAAELLRAVGDLAESASFEDKCLLLWLRP